LKTEILCLGIAINLHISPKDNNEPIGPLDHGNRICRIADNAKNN